MACHPQIFGLNNRAALVADLLYWFATTRRDLPWRQANDPYGIWVSEIMLQQTTVQTVVPYWQRFMARFPTVGHLARAEPDDVLALWSGLGYYTRAHNLHAAAQLICETGGGRLPGSRDQWLALPGVGPYTAGAIASIALGEAVPALDANARRVLLRWTTLDPAALARSPDSKVRRAIDSVGAELVPVASPGNWNEALMELGALVCGARRTRCEVCPVSRHCHARLGGWVAEVPPVRGAAGAVPAEVVQLVLTWRGRVLLVPPPAVPLPLGQMPGDLVRSDFSGLHRGLWGLPMSGWFVPGSAGRVPWLAWRERLELPAAIWSDSAVPREVGAFRHAITRFRLRVVVHHLELPGRRALPPDWLRDGSAAGLVPAQRGFFAVRGPRPSVSALTEKALHFHQDTVV